MKRAELEKANQVLAEIKEMLNDPSLPPEKRQELELHAAALSGAMLSDWLPLGLTRKMAMLLIFFFGLYGMVSGNEYWGFAWLLLPLFSPRVIGYLAFAAGQFAAGAAAEHPPQSFDKIAATKNKR